ncbi:MAG: ABC transporter permease [Gammaproteobacteria bacterium]
MAAIRAHKLRSFLTTLGIMIAVAAVITVVSLLQGFRHSVNNTFANLGSNVLTIQSNITQEDFLSGKFPKVTPADLQAIQHEVAGISNLAPELALAGFGSGTVQAGGQTTSASISGVTSRFSGNAGYYPAMGRLIVPSDDLADRRVAVIGQTIITNLHLPADPIGQYVKMYGEWFKIIGVTKKLGNIGGQDMDDVVYIPYGTAHSLLGASKVPDITIQATVNSTLDIAAVSNRITEVLRRMHHLRPGQDNDFLVQTPEQTLGTFNTIIGGITLVLGSIVGISLLVGGIGIMNIMLVSVTERTREIGLRLAIGARPRDIRSQFVIEAVGLCTGGGAVGVALGFGVASLVAHGAGWPVALDPATAMGAVVFSGLVGILFGYYPAKRAAALDPVAALRGD